MSVEDSDSDSESNEQTNNFLPANIESLAPEIITKAEKELNETPTGRGDSLKEMKILLQSEKNLRPWTDDKFLLRFLRTRKFDLQVALKTLKNYYSYKAKYSRVLTDKWPSEVKHILEMNLLMILPQRDQAGCLVGLGYLGNMDFREMSLNDLISTVIVCIEHCCQSEVTQICGMVIVINLKGMTFNQIVHCANYKLIRPTVQALQDCVPLRLKAVHFVNEPKFFNILFIILRKCFSSKLQKRIHFHGSNLKSLHKKISPAILPEELGGHQGPMNSTKFAEEILAKEHHYTKVIQYGYLDVLGP